MKSRKVCTNKSVFRHVAEDFFYTKQAISQLLYSRALASANLWYEEMYCGHTEELRLAISQYAEGEYGYLGNEGVTLFLLFLAEYEENP